MFALHCPPHADEIFITVYWVLFFESFFSTYVNAENLVDDVAGFVNLSEELFVFWELEI